MKELHGAGVALVTPFHKDGTVDFEGLTKLIELQIEGGIDYLVVLGTTGETATLSKDEKKEVFTFVSDKVNGRVPLVAGLGGNNTAEIVVEVSHFNMQGYVAILSVSPYYNKPTQEGIYQHYKAVAEASILPIILYNVPGRTGSNMSPATTIRLANEFEKIVATKEASGSFAQFSEILRDKPDGFLLISGDDPITLPMMALGAVGIISVVGNAYPEKISALAKLCAQGNYELARPIHEELLYITELCFVDGNPCGVKNILKNKLVCDDNVRLPLVKVTEKTATLIRNEMAKIG